MTYNSILSGFQDSVNNIIIDVLKYDFDNDPNTTVDEVRDIVDQQVWEMVDGSEEVIYTHQARQICDVLNVDIFEPCEMTGERYNSWSQAAFMAIINLLNDQCNYDDMIAAVIEDLG